MGTFRRVSQNVPRALYNSEAMTPESNDERESWREFRPKA